MMRTVNLKWVKISSFNCSSNRHLTTLCPERSNCRMSSWRKKWSNSTASSKLSMIRVPLSYAGIMRWDCSRLLRQSRCKPVHLKCYLTKTSKSNSQRSKNRRRTSTARESRNSSKSLSWSRNKTQLKLNMKMRRRGILIGYSMNIRRNWNSLYLNWNLANNVKSLRFIRENFTRTLFKDRGLTKLKVMKS